MRALIVANGTPPGAERLAEAIDAADFVLAADGGANKLAALGLRCDCILGDFDSLDLAVFPNVPRVAAVDQDHTDIDKAIAYAIAQGATSIVMTGVTGDRLDHTFGALSMLVKYGRKVDLALLDDVGRARLVNDEIVIPTHASQAVSLLPLGHVEGVSTMGLRWELDGDSLAAGVRDGISNEATGDTVSVTCWGGDLVVYWHG